MTSTSTRVLGLLPRKPDCTERRDRKINTSDTDAEPHSNINALAKFAATALSPVLAGIRADKPDRPAFPCKQHSGS